VRIVLPLLVLMLFVTTTDGGNTPVSSDLPDIDTSRGFLEMCATVDKNATDQSQSELFRTGYCLGWIAGLTKGMHVAEAIHRVGGKNAIFCPPEGNSYAQMIQIIEKFIADHPEKEHLPKGIIASAALAEAFPCKESK
jgi:hypothetical protein